MMQLSDMTEKQIQQLIDLAKAELDKRSEQRRGQLIAQMCSTYNSLTKEFPNTILPLPRNYAIETPHGEWDILSVYETLKPENFMNHPY